MDALGPRFTMPTIEVFCDHFTREFQALIVRFSDKIEDSGSGFLDIYREIEEETKAQDRFSR